MVSLTNPAPPPVCSHTRGLRSLSLGGGAGSSTLPLPDKREFFTIQTEAGRRHATLLLGCPQERAPRASVTQVVT